MFSLIRRGLEHGLFGKGFADQAKKIREKSATSGGQGSMFSKVIDAAMGSDAAKSIGKLTENADKVGGGGMFSSAIKGAVGQAKKSPIADMLKIDKSKPKSSTKSKGSLTSLIKQLGQNPTIGRKGGLPSLMGGGVINI